MQQRGVAASQEVLQAILDGVLEQGPARVHCVDLVPSRPGEIALQEWLTLARYNEWGRAVLQHQKQALTSAQSHVYHFTAYGITAEEKDLEGPMVSFGRRFSYWHRHVSGVAERCVL